MSTRGLQIVLGDQMKKFLAIGLTGLVIFTTHPANAAPVIVEKKFANCTALNKVYPGGVAKSKSVRNKGGVTKKVPTVSSKVYAENRTKDRDGDGIACER